MALAIDLPPDVEGALAQDARRQREGDELLAALRDDPASFRRVNLSDWPDGGDDVAHYRAAPPNL